MNRILVVLLIACLSSCFVAYFCTKTKMNQKQAAVQTASAESRADDLVKTTITNPVGDKLDMTFNNANQTATFVFRGELIKLKQDTLASGIQCSNAHYVYREHQGEVTLKKDGKTVFTAKK